ncbi:MAG: carbohydrate ABC transporter permease [Candidatus Velthaea sp.]
MNARLAHGFARLVLGLAAVLALAPLAFMLGTALKPEHDVFAAAANPFPMHPTVANFRAALAGLAFPRLFAVSITFALGVTLGQLLLAIPAAYAFARERVPGGDVLFALVVATLPIPFVVTYIPNYLVLARAGMLGTLPGLIVPQLACAYAIFLLRQHFRAFPRSVIDAAAVDGAGPFATLVRVVVPANGAALAALGIYIFVNTWNQYIWPLLVLNDPAFTTLTVGVQNFANGEGGSAWGTLMAAATLATLPTLVAYAAVRKTLLATLAEGAVKG